MHNENDGLVSIGAYACVCVCATGVWQSMNEMINIFRWIWIRIWSVSTILVQRLDAHKCHFELGEYIKYEMITTTSLPTAERATNRVLMFEMVYQRIDYCCCQSISNSNKCAQNTRSSYACWRNEQSRQSDDNVRCAYADAEPFVDDIGPRTGGQ